jgi:large subunit ribosomal protein L21
MFAIIKQGGFQYRVQANDVVKFPLMDVEAGSAVEITEVLHVSGDDAKDGGKVAPKATVRGTVIRHARDRKIVVYTYKRRQGFEKKRGHRTDFTEVRIDSITVG